MEEAEVYGKELERGKSMNQFVMSSKNPNDDLIITGPTNLTVRAGQNTELPCIVQRVKSKYWMKGGIQISFRDLVYPKISYILGFLYDRI